MRALDLQHGMVTNSVRYCDNRGARDTEAHCGSDDERDVSDLGELLHRKKHRRIVAQEQHQKEQARTQTQGAIPVPVPEPEHQAQ